MKNTSKTFLIPGKIFISGEYAILAGGSALLLSTLPQFKVTIFGEEADTAEIELAEGKQLSLHAESLASQYWQAAEAATGGRPLPRIELQDPYACYGGGMGRSGAEFIAMYLAKQHKLSLASCDLREVYQAYKQAQQLKQAKIYASGADILSQLSSKLVTAIDGRKSANLALATNSLDWPFMDLRTVILFTGHKLLTHEHLAQLELKAAYLRELAALSHLAYASFLAKDLHKFVYHCEKMLDSLAKQNLYSENSYNLCQELQQLQRKHFLFAKGCGAMGNDTLLVICEQPILAEVLQWAKSKNLPCLPVCCY